jgi:hypothetical protein
MAPDATRRGILSDDTTWEAEQRQIEIWRRMSTVEIAALIDGASRTVRALTLAGLRSRFPDASERELFLRMAAITLGTDLARKAYPEIDRLEL